MYAKLAVTGVCVPGWAAGLRGLMAQVAGQESAVSWFRSPGVPPNGFEIGNPRCSSRSIVHIGMI
jgi:hypothetical protein